MVLWEHLTVDVSTRENDESVNFQRRPKVCSAFGGHRKNGYFPLQLCTQLCTIVHTMRKRITRFIGIRELRQNLSKLLEEVQKKNIYFVVMRHGKPVSHISPPESKENIPGEFETILPPPKSLTERKKILQKIRKMNLQFTGHDGVAYQRRQRA